MKFLSSVKVCLQLFGTAYLFTEIEYHAEQVSVSESIAEIFPSDTWRLAFLESEGSPTLALLLMIFKVALIIPH